MLIFLFRLLMMQLLSLIHWMRIATRILRSLCNCCATTWRYGRLTHKTTMNPRKPLETTNSFTKIFNIKKKLKKTIIIFNKAKQNIYTLLRETAPHHLLPSHHICALTTRSLFLIYSFFFFYTCSLKSRKFE